MLRRGRLDSGDRGIADGPNPIPADRGVTFSVTPSADIAAPVTEISISGYAKSDFIYDFNQNLGDAFGVANLKPAPKFQKFHSHARQTRISVASRTDTSIGEFQTLIEGDFFSSSECSSTGCLRLRHAWGEWQFFPNWTFSAGQYWSNFMPLFDLPDTVDFEGPVGLAFSRQGQARLTYSTGNLTAALALERPFIGTVTSGESGEAEGLLFDNDSNLPDLTASILYKSEAGHQLGFNAILGQLGVDGEGKPNSLITGSDRTIDWGIIGSAQIMFTDAFQLTVSGGGGRGASSYIVGADVNVYVTGTAADPNIGGRVYYNFAVSGALEISPEITLNTAYGQLYFANNDTLETQTKLVQTVHANTMWRPVSQMQLGLEIMWAKRNIKQSTNADALRGQFGAWFFF